MKKIKKFKVNLREREVVRNLKITADIKEFTPQLKEAVLKEMQRASEYLSPASVFDTFELEESIEKFGIEIEQSLKISAVSIIVVTVGKDLEKEIETADSGDEKLPSQIIHAIGLESLNSSLSLIYKILKEDARKEQCELLPIEKVLDDMEKEIIKKFDTQRINVYVNDRNQIEPTYTSAAMVKWIPLTKRKKPLTKTP